MHEKELLIHKGNCISIIIGSISVGLTSVSTWRSVHSFSSTLAGLYDLTVVIIGIVLISYIGGKMNKPRVLGFSVIMLKVLAVRLIMASHQFIFGADSQSSG